MRSREESRAKETLDRVLPSLLLLCGRSTTAPFFEPPPLPIGAPSHRHASATRQPQALPQTSFTVVCPTNLAPPRFTFVCIRLLLLGRLPLFLLPTGFGYCLLSC